MRLNHRRLKYLREEQKIKQLEMARSIGLEQSLLSKYENGKVPNPSAAIVKAMANYLKCNMDDLLLTEEDYAKEITTKINYKKLTELRKNLGITQTTMSKDLGILRANLSRYETGAIKNPSPKIIKAIANYLDCNINDLLWDKEEDSQAISNRIDIHVHFHWGE